MWGGGVAFYDPDLPGHSAARAYLITTQQFTDVLTQERNLDPPDTDSDDDVLDLTEAVTTGRQQVSPGNYDTVIGIGTRRDVPLVTFTTSHGKEKATLTPPSAAYRRVLDQGLREAHGWDPTRVAAYLDALLQH